MILRAFALAAAMLAAVPAAAQPIPYEATVAPRQNWREHAALHLSGALPADEAAPKALTLNNYWALRQDPKHPWRGTPRFDGYDGNSDGRLAVFSDPRFAARAFAIELRDLHKAGVTSAAGVAARLNPENPAPLASVLAAAAGAAVDQPMGLFDERGPTPRLAQVMRRMASHNLGSGLTPSDSLIHTGLEAVRYDRFDQSAEGYAGWRAANPEWTPQVQRFEAFLSSQGLAGRFPTYQLLRTASDWNGCGAPFTVPPEEHWPNAAATLRLIADRVQPALPGLQVMSGYRPEWLNVCAGGAGRSAHREYSAFDLVPADGVSREALMARVCPILASEGAARNMGLGFYSGVRFHIDTRSHRTWASFNRVSYSPCASDGRVNPVPDVPPPPPPFPPVYPSR